MIAVCIIVDYGDLYSLTLISLVMMEIVDVFIIVLTLSGIHC